MDALEARALFDRAISDLCRDFNASVCTPLLEADVAAYIHHRLLVNGCPANMTYLATRVLGESARRRKPDLVIGELDRSTASVRPLLICEIKAFQRWGLTDQQMRRRFQGVLEEDVPTLAEMAACLPDGRIELLADFFVSAYRNGYLTGTFGGRSRIEVVADACSDAGAALVWLRPDARGEVSPVTVVEQPSRAA